MKKKMLVGLIVLSLILAACAPTQPEAPTEVVADPTEVPVDEPEIVKIGFYGPLTGPISLAGRALARGAEMKFNEVNAAGGVLGKQIEYITCDDKSTPEEAVKCVQRLYSQDNVTVMVGTLHSPHIMATGPITDEFKIPTVAVGTSPTWCQQGFEYVWRGAANALVAQQTLSRVFEGAGFETLAILYQNDDYGISGRDAFTESLPMDVVITEAYTLGDKDWGGQIISMLSANPDIIGVYSLGEDLAPIINQIRGQGWDDWIIGPEGSTYIEIPIVAGENSNKLVFSQPYYIPEKPEDYPVPIIAEFLEKYLAIYGEMPADDNAYRGWDSASILITAIENAGSFEPEAIRDAINSISNYQGLGGSFNFAEGGCEGISESQVWEWRDGRIVPFGGFR